MPRMTNEMIFKAIAEGFENLNKQIKGTGEETEKAGKGGKTAFAGLDSAALKLVGSLGGVAAGARLIKAGFAELQKSADVFVQFEKRAQEVWTLLPQMSRDAFNSMRDDALDFGVDAGRLSEETIPAIYQAISAGVPSDNVFDFMTTASDAALGGVTELETAVDGLSSVVNAYGSSVISATEASDLMFTAVKGGKTDFEQLSRFLFQVVPTAAALKVEFGNVTAALATITAQGTPTRVAATQLRQVLIELSKAGGETAKIFEEVSGVTFRDFIAQGGNLQDALQLMEDHANTLGIGLNDLFSSVEAGNGALQLTGAATEKFTSELNSAETAEGATTEAADKMRETLDFLGGQVDAATDRLRTHIGEGLGPVTRAYLKLKLAVLEYLDTGVEGNLRNQQARSELEKQVKVLEYVVEASEDFRREGDLVWDTENRMIQITDELNKQFFRMGQGADVSAQKSAVLQAAIDLLRDGFDGTVEELIKAAQETLIWGRASERVAPAIDEINQYLNTQEDAAGGAADGLSDLNDEGEDNIIISNLMAAAGRLVPPALDEITAASTAAAEAQAELTAQQQAEAEASERAAARALELAEARAAAAEAVRAVGAQISEYLVDVEGTAEVTENIGASFIDMAAKAGAMPGALAGGAVALGVWDEAAAESYLKGAILRQGLEELAAQFAATGDVSAMIAGVDALEERIANLDLSIDTATGRMSEDMPTATQATIDKFAEMSGDQGAAGTSAALDDVVTAADGAITTLGTNLPTAAEAAREALNNATFEALSLEEALGLLPSEVNIDVNVRYNLPEGVPDYSDPNVHYNTLPDQPGAPGGLDDGMGNNTVPGNASSGGGQGGMYHGGSVQPGYVYPVNEMSSNEVFVPRVPGRIVSEGDAMRAVSGAYGGMGGGINVTIENLIIDGSSGNPEMMAGEIAWQLGAKLKGG